MKETLWTKEGRWFKGNLHIHTKNSDGALSLAETLAQYRGAGYDFVAISDHNIVSDVEGFSDESFLALRGAEISAGETERGGDVHILGIDLPKGFDARKRARPQEAIDAILAAGGIALVAHPYWSGLEAEDLAKLNGFSGVETFNSSCHFSIGKGRSDAQWDSLLARGREVYGFASDDCHNHFNEHRPNDAAFAWIMVKAKALDRASLMAALKRGDFYASFGPEIKDFHVENGLVGAKCSPVKTLVLHAEPGRGKGEAFTAKDGFIEGAVHKARGTERYFRIEAIDEFNRVAWSGPIFPTKREEGA